MRFDKQADLQQPHRMPSPQVYGELAAALRNRLAIIADRAAYERDPAAHLVQLQRASEEIEALRARLPSPASPTAEAFFGARKL
jgi:hypothetical protein